jgi:outer membrane biosynthesis protein TonB
MKSRSFIQPRMVATILGTIAIAGGLVAHRAKADEWNKKTILTVNQPIQVTHTVLQPGTYVFKLADSQSDRHIVQIFNGDQTQIIDTVLAIPNYRLRPTGNSQFAFWETPPGTARALRAWFYPGDNFGQEFAYPKQLAMLETPAPPPAPPAPAPAPVPEAPAPAPAPAPQPEPQPQAMTTPQEPAPAPAEIAQSAPPPAPVPQPEPQPTELPKTASSYPLVGLGGLLSLGAFTLLRLKRVA